MLTCRFWIERRRFATRTITRSSSSFLTASECSCHYLILSSTIALSNWRLCSFSCGKYLNELGILMKRRLTSSLLFRYYCTLTIRESILKVNGSRIKGWWRLHHFISTVCAGVLLIWPQGEPWQLFRTQFMYFNVYISELIHSSSLTLYSTAIYM